MFSESTLLHLSICMTGLFLFAGGMIRQKLASGWGLRQRRRISNKIFSRRRAASAKMEQKRAVLAKKRAKVEQQLGAVQWSGRAKWQDDGQLNIAALGAASV